MSLKNSDKTIVVFGVTGKQGGSTARALLNDGFRVVGITRNPDSDSAKGEPSPIVTSPLPVPFPLFSLSSRR